MSGKWHFERQTLTRPSGKNVTELGFTRESKSMSTIFTREFNQNVLDARCDNRANPRIKEHARITMSLKKPADVDVDYLYKILDPLEEHLVAAGHPEEERDRSKLQILVIEEFNTVGLTGGTENSFLDDEQDRWANFWFGEGKVTKTRNSLGRQGAGKITYHIISGARAVLALTRREEDPVDYVFGKSIFGHTHEVAGKRYTQQSYWPSKKNVETEGVTDIQPIPETDPGFVAHFKSAFGLTRDAEPGTSWIIPFVPKIFSSDVLVSDFVRDFFVSILLGRFSAEICGKTINGNNLQNLIKESGLSEPSEEFFGFLEDAVTTPSSRIVEVENSDWMNDKKIDEAVFDESDLARIRNDLEDGQLVSVQLPVTVKKNDEDPVESHIIVHVQITEGKRKGEELYLRSDLQIGDEKWLHNTATNAYGLMRADDPVIAEFLACCEESSHLKWNAKNKEALDQYGARQTSRLLSAVRQSLPRIYRLLAGSDGSYVEDALADILSVAVPGSAKKKTKTSKVKEENRTITPDPPPPPPPPGPRYYDYPRTQAHPGRWSFRPGPDIGSLAFPQKEVFQFAYNRLPGTGNPFGKYLIWDFDLANSIHDPMDSKNITILRRDANELEIEILDPDFALSIEGFAATIPLVSKRETP